VNSSLGGVQIIASPEGAYPFDFGTAWPPPCEPTSNTCAPGWGSRHRNPPGRSSSS